MTRNFNTRIGPSKEGPIFVPDLLRLGLDIPIELTSPLAPGHLHMAAKEKGFKIKSARRLGPEGISIKIPIMAYNRVIGHATLDLSALPMNCGLRFGGRSSLCFNPISLTRSLMYPRLTTLSLDDRTNFLPDPAALNDEFLTQTLNIVALVVDSARVAMEALLPPGSVVTSDRVWLQAAEAAHDSSHPDAISVAQAACHIALRQSRICRHDTYYRSGTSYNQVPTARHQATENGPITKVYPKTSNIVRVEVSCPTRKSMKLLCGAQSACFIGDAVVELVTQFLDVAGDIGKSTLEDVANITRSTKSLPALVRELDPLLRATEGQSVAGGYSLKEDDQAAAERAYQDLIFQGRHWAKGAKTRSGLRRLLDSLCLPEGPLSKSERGPWYFLKCDFAEAVKSLAIRESEIEIISKIKKFQKYHREIRQER